MKKKCIIMLFLMLFICGLMTNTFSYVNGKDKTKTEELITQMGTENVSDVDTTYASKGIGKMINTVIRIIQVAGTGISIIVVTIAGIKYMMASPNDKAEYKKQLVPIIIGCILLFGAVNIAGIIADFGDGFNPTKENTQQVDSN